jgi:LPXTG-motif cell wall-anchored protein
MIKKQFLNLFAVSLSSLITFILSFTYISAAELYPSYKINKVVDIQTQIQNYLPLIIAVLLVLIGFLLIFWKKKQSGFIKTKITRY